MQSHMVRVWDPLVRIGHWLLAVGFVVAYLTEDDFETLHVWAGYLVGAIVVVRVIWGFVGPRHARFADFAYTPRLVFSYLMALLRGGSKRYLGHSPAGGAMAIALLGMLAATTFTGLAHLAYEDNAGPLAPWFGPAASLSFVGAARASDNDDDDTHEGREKRGEGGHDSLYEEAHEVLANLTLLLVILHIGGVALASFAHRENLVRAMVTGRKRAP